MPLPGGPADKLGNRYETMWTIVQLIRLLFGKIESIRIEEPSVAKAEFVITTVSRRELHQLKRSHPSGKWSLASLRAEGVLEAIYKELAGTSDKFVFVSSSDAPELRELTERAVDAGSLEEFDEYFLQSQELRTSFETLRSVWNISNSAEVLDLLRRIEVRTIDERGVRDQVDAGLRALFLEEPGRIGPQLQRIATDAIHKTLTRVTLQDTLQAMGLFLRRIADPASAAVAIGEITDRYIQGVRKQLIQHAAVPHTTELIDRLRQPGETVLLGPAGTGKTALVGALVGGLRDQGVPVLVFRLDRLEPVASTKALGEQLGLTESPVLALAEASGDATGVLVVDQVDAVSTASGRSASFLDAVQEILQEARGIRIRVPLHVVIVSRLFDWKHDYRLRRLVPDESAIVTVSPFSLDATRAVLTAQGFDPNAFRRKQLELLQLPQNLSLFLDGDFDRRRTPGFSTATELFDHYWDEKRRSVAARASPAPDQWSEVIDLLTTQMTLSQQLSVRREALDAFAPDFLAQMVSEGVLTYDDSRYAFNHESFFDYCFARSFLRRTDSLTQLLVSSDQHLFRRAQVRQVLTYSRDADRGRYLDELRTLLSDTRVRAHAKDVALAVLADVPDPSDEEWAILQPWVASLLTSLAHNQPREVFAQLVWHHFFFSPSWFAYVDAKRLVEEWLASPFDAIADSAILYLRVHQRHSADRLVAHLGRYEHAGERWKTRLRHIMEWADLGTSRSFFELFLRLIDNGTLDEAKGPIAVNSTFWSLMHGLSRSQPSWIPEVLAHWMRRRTSVLGSGGDTQQLRELFGHERFGTSEVEQVAQTLPDVFVKHVLPAVLEVTDRSVFPNSPAPPHRGAIWGYFIQTEHPGLEEVVLDSLAAALKACSASSPMGLTGALRELRQRDTYVANHLLLNTFMGNPAHYADEAASLLVAEPWRFECGYSDSPHWTTSKLVEAIAPHCSAPVLGRLLDTITSYKSDWERSVDGFRDSGRTAFALMSGIDESLLTPVARTRLGELQRKFKSPERPPRGIRVGWVGPPITPAATERMTDAQWIRAMNKYTADWGNPGGPGLTGGAVQLSRQLKPLAAKTPQRFIALGQKLSPKTNPVYMDAILEGVAEAAEDNELLTLCRYAFMHFPEGAGHRIADVLGKIRSPLPQDGLAMLTWLATSHPSPDHEAWQEHAPSGSAYYGGDMATWGINTTRGRAALALAQRLTRHQAEIPAMETTVRRLCNDASLGVRSCAAHTVDAIARHNPDLGIELAEELVSHEDPRLLGAEPVVGLLNVLGHSHAARIMPILERMVRSDDPAAQEAGARLAGLIRFSHQEAEALVQEALNGNAAHRLGIARVAAANVQDLHCRSWCMAQLPALFNDDDAEVRDHAAKCFRYLEGADLAPFEALIGAFCDARAFGDDSFSLLHLLENATGQLPGLTCLVCERFLQRFGEDAKDISNRRGGDIRTVATLVIRTYAQHQSDSWTARALDLIDRLCLLALHDVKEGLADFER